MQQYLQQLKFWPSKTNYSVIILWWFCVELKLQCTAAAWWKQHNIIIVFNLAQVLLVKAGNNNQYIIQDFKQGLIRKFLTKLQQFLS